MGKRPAVRQGSPLWVTTADLPTNAGHPFFERLNRVLEEAGFDAFIEGLCAVFYAARMGRPSLRPGRYFRMLFIGYFEGPVVRTRDCVAGVGLAESADVPGPGCDRGVAGPLDAVTDAPDDRRGDSRSGLQVGSGAFVRGGSGPGKDDRHRCDDAGSERGDAEHRAAGHGRILRGVHSTVGGSVRGGDADAGGLGSVRPVSEGQEDVEHPPPRPSDRPASGSLPVVSARFVRFGPQNLMIGSPYVCKGVVCLMVVKPCILVTDGRHSVCRMFDARRSDGLDTVCPCPLSSGLMPWDRALSICSDAVPVVGRVRVLRVCDLERGLGALPSRPPPMQDATRALGVSRQTTLQRVKPRRDGERRTRRARPPRTDARQRALTPAVPKSDTTSTCEAR